MRLSVHPCPTPQACLLTLLVVKDLFGRELNQRMTCMCGTHGWFDWFLSDMRKEAQIMSYAFSFPE